MPQMSHCSRCRADAVGLINDEMKESDFELLKSVSNEKYSKEGRNFIAVGSREGLLVNQHLGEIANIYIYENKNNKPELVEIRVAPLPGKGEIRWHEFSYIIRDCSLILVSGSGDNPEKIFSGHGIKIIKTEGFIEDVISRIFTGKKIIEKTNEGCGRGLSCTGTGSGCG
jgi:nitrogen fixation protein NifB